MDWYKTISYWSTVRWPAPVKLLLDSYAIEIGTQEKTEIQYQDTTPLPQHEENGTEDSDQEQP